MLADARRRINIAGGDAERILRQLNIVEIEMADVYDLAMGEIERVIPARPDTIIPDEYSEIVVRRFEVLCRIDPDKARAFRLVLLSLGIVSDDPRVCLEQAQTCSTARGSMELEVLPQNWSSNVSSSHPDRIFYVGPSGQSQWEHPEDDRDAEHARLGKGEQDDDSGATSNAYLRDELRISRVLPTVKPSRAPSLLCADRARASSRFSSRSPRLPPPPPHPRSLSPINARGSASRSLRSLHYDAARWERAPKSPPP